MAIFCFYLAACGQAVPVAWTIASGGYTAFKAVQVSTGGSAEVRFKDVKLSPEDQELLSSIKRLAISPESPKGVKFAEYLSQYRRYEVVTPHAVRTTCNNLGLYYSPQMTEQEKIQLVKQIETALNFDGMLIYSEKGAGTDTKLLSLKRPEIATDFSLKILSPKLERVILNMEGQLALKYGSHHPSQDEIDKILVSSCVEKLFEYERFR